MADQQVTPFQPTFSPAQQGLGSIQPYQAPDTPAMESTPQDYYSQYAPTQQYNAPAASPMTAGLGSYMEGLKYQAPPPPPPPAAPAARNYSWNSGKYADEAALRGALGTYATQNSLDPSSVDTWMGDQATYGISSTPAAATAAAAPSTTTAYDPQTQQYTAPVEPAAPAAAAPAVNYGLAGYAEEPYYGSPGAAGGHVNGSTIGYAQGGSIPQGIASLGRGQDSMLVHMTPGEVQGLQQLAMAHGGSLTINPQTGLPEAGFLSSLLPMAAAAAAIYFTGGAATPLVAGAEGAAATGGTFMGLTPSVWGTGAGALTGALTNKQSPLMGAISGGISGATMGGVGESLATAGAAPEINVAATNTLRNAEIDKLVANYATSPVAEGMNASPYMNTDQYRSFLNLPENVAKFTPPTPAELAKNLASPESQNIIKANYLGNMEKGLQGLSSEQGRNAFIGTAASKGVPATGLGGGMSAAMKGAGLAAPLISSALTPAPFTPPAKIPTQYAHYGDSTNPGYRPPKYNPLTGDYDPASYGPVSYSTNPTQYGAEGGVVGYASGGAAQIYRGGPGEDPENSRDIYSPGVSLSDMAEARADKMTLAQLERAAEDSDTAPEQAAATKRLQLAMAKLRPAKSTYTKAAGGGLMGLNTYAAGGKLLRGPGDGMSDSIPAVIQGANPQRAALADGEFVIPADVVSHLGNGSTEAGSKRLYSMMDKVRRARTGNPKQGKQINPNKFLPA